VQPNDSTVTNRTLKQAGVICVLTDLIDEGRSFHMTNGESENICKDTAVVYCELLSNCLPAGPEEIEQIIQFGVTGNSSTFS